MIGYQIYFTTKAYVQLLTEIADYPYVETGGVLVGQRRGNTFYVFETVDPGFKADRQRAEFSRHYEYTEHLAYKVANQYEGKTTVVGYYHRHPGSYDHFSGGDDISNLEFAQTFNGVISGLVNIDPEFRLAFYYISPEGRQSKAISYKVDDKAFEGIMILKNSKQLIDNIIRQENKFTISQKKLDSTLNTKERKKESLWFKIIRLFIKEKNHKEQINLTQEVFSFIKEDIDKLEEYSPEIAFSEKNAMSFMSLKINNFRFCIVFKILKRRIQYAFLTNENTYPDDEQFQVLRSGIIYKGIKNYILKKDNLWDIMN